MLEVDYTYDALGNRLSETVTQAGQAPVVSEFAYDANGNVWADMDGNNNLLTRRFYLAGQDQLAARIEYSTSGGSGGMGAGPTGMEMGAAPAGSGGSGSPSGPAVAWYLTDKNGSVQVVTNATGQAADQMTYDAYGNVTSESTPSAGDRYKFDGREFDSADGLEYNRARYYDPTTGRWISQDPIGFDGGQSNLYQYVGNNPANGTDPSGLIDVTHVTFPSNDAENP